MTVFQATVTLKGNDDKEVKRYYDLGDFTEGSAAADYAAAESAINQITGALAPITDATITLVTLTAVVSEDNATPGGGDVFQNALLNLYLNAGGTKVTQLYVPAPSVGIFVAPTGPNYDIVDVTDADLVQFVQQISQHAFVSDNEQVDVTLQNGIKSGIRSIRALQLVKQ